MPPEFQFPKADLGGAVGSESDRQLRGHFHEVVAASNGGSLAGARRLPPSPRALAGVPADNGRGATRRPLPNNDGHIRRPFR